jgi:hypothetical protein
LDAAWRTDIGHRALLRGFIAVDEESVPVECRPGEGEVSLAAGGEEVDLGRRWNEQTNQTHVAPDGTHASMHLAVFRFPAGEVLRDERGAVLRGDGKDGTFVVIGRNTIISRVLDFGAVRSAATLDGIPVVGARG